MKIAIVTTTARTNPRLDLAARTLAYAIGKAKSTRPDVQFDWVIVDEKGRGLNQLMSPNEAAAVVLAMHQTSVVQPPQTIHRLQPDPRPAHNTARNAGLEIAHQAKAEYVVMLNDCNVVTPDWATVAADIAKLELGWKCKTKVVFDFAVPSDGKIRAGDHNDRLHDVPALSATGACWGVPMAKLLEVGGFDTAYDGQSYCHDLECALRLARVGVSFVTTERAFTVMMRRTKLDHEISTNKESHAGKANRTRFATLRRDTSRILPTQFAADQSLATAAAGVAPSGTGYSGEFGDAFTAAGELSAAGATFSGREARPFSQAAPIAPAAPAVAAPEEDDPSMITVTFVGRLDEPRCLNLLKRSIKDFTELYEIVKIETKGKPSNAKTSVSYRPLYPAADGKITDEPVKQDDPELPAADEIDIDDLDDALEAKPIDPNAKPPTLADFAPVATSPAPDGEPEDDGLGSHTLPGTYTLQAAAVAMEDLLPGFAKEYVIVEMRDGECENGAPGTEVIFREVEKPVDPGVLAEGVIENELEFDTGGPS